MGWNGTRCHNHHHLLSFRRRIHSERVNIPLAQSKNHFLSISSISSFSSSPTGNSIGTDAKCITRDYSSAFFIRQFVCGHKCVSIFRTFDSISNPNRFSSCNSSLQTLWRFNRNANIGGKLSKALTIYHHLSLTVESSRNLNFNLLQYSRKIQLIPFPDRGSSWTDRI